MLTLWGWYNSQAGVLASSQKILPVFAILGLIRYSLLLIRWGSNRPYALLGGHRGVAQTLSYEVCLFLFALVWFFIQESYSFNKINLIQQRYWGALFIAPLFSVWLTLCLAESNRTPFDLSEGEREIVSGFNIEYGGGIFALIFISEYGIIMALRFITSIIFISRNFLTVKTILIRTFYIWARRSFPRVRYDHLIIIAWKIAVPFSLVVLTARIFFNV